MRGYERVEVGKNTGGRYTGAFFATLGILLVGAIIGVFLLILIVVSDGNKDTYIDASTFEIVGLNPIVTLAISHISYLFWLLGIWISVRFILKRPFRTLITPLQQINWKRIWFGFGIFIVLYILVLIIDLLVFASSYTWNGFSSQFGWLLLFVLVLTPIQTTVEELFFRGFLLQWFAKGIKNHILLALIIGFIFGALHFTNPEMTNSKLFMGLDYVMVGFMLTIIALKTKTLEFSLAAHAANNMFIFLFIQMENSVGGDLPSLFTVVGLSPKSGLFLDLLLFGAYLIIAMNYMKKEKAIHS